MSFIEPVSLSGSLVVLDPLQVDHHDGLVEAASDGELWTLGYTGVPQPNKMHEAIHL